MQVMQCILLAVTLLAVIHESAALPLPNSFLSTVTIGGEVSSSYSGSLIRRGLFHRKKKTEEEEQQEAREKVLLSHGRGLKSEDLQKLSDEDFHKYMSQHVSRLDHNEANKLAKHLAKKAEEHSYKRAKSLDAIHAQLEKHVEGYKSDYESAHWAGDYAKTAELAKDKNPTVDDLHQIVQQSQHQINRLHDASKELKNHVNKLKDQHKWERQQEGKDVKTSTAKTLMKTQKSFDKIDMTPNVKKAYEEQEAKKAAEVERKKKEAEEERQRKANKAAGATGWPLQGKIGSILGYKSPSKNSSGSTNGSNRSQSSLGSQKDKAKVDASVGRKSGSSRIGSEEGGSSKNGGSGRTSTSDEDGGSVSSGTNSQSGSPTSVLPGYFNAPNYHRKNSW